uniref:Uncharacterized protein n=1 Tax=Ciona savignyi TaxID=51511 RepID=H2YDR7_CIOSA
MSSCAPKNRRRQPLNDHSEAKGDGLLIVLVITPALGALRKLFEKRDSSTADLDDEAIPLNNKELDNLAQDFIRFIEIRGIRSIEIRRSTDLVMSLFYHVLLRV